MAESRQEEQMSKFLDVIISDENMKNSIRVCDWIIDNIMKVLNSYSLDNVIFELDGGNSVNRGIARWRDEFNCVNDGRIFDIYFHNMELTADVVRFTINKSSTISDIDKLGLKLVDCRDFAMSVATKNMAYLNMSGMLSVKDFIIHMISLYDKEQPVTEYYIKLRVCMKLSQKLNINFMW